jgi:uncharacterized protein
MTSNRLVIAAGAAMGILGVLLTVWGNPENSGICISCFMETTAGALGLHANERLQYLRPELMGFVLGACGSALQGREFRSRGGSAPIVRLAAGVLLIVGCAVFIGCPIKLMLRFAAGDFGAIAGIAGLVAGVWIGIRSYMHGVDMPTSSGERGEGGMIVPIAAIGLLAIFFIRPVFLQVSATGGGAAAAPWVVSFISAVVLGMLAQRSRFCITGSLRDMLLMGIKTPMFAGFMAFAMTAVGTAVLTGRFHPGLAGQPGAHGEHLWSFLGMLLVGWIAVLVGGCPFRQLVKAGEGDADAGLVTVGMLLGAAIVQAWGIAATAAGVPLAGKLATLLGLMATILAVMAYRKRS